MVLACVTEFGDKRGQILLDTATNYTIDALETVKVSKSITDTAVRISVPAQRG